MVAVEVRTVEPLVDLGIAARSNEVRSCFDPEEAPGVNTPATKGLFKQEVIPVMQELVASNPNFRALEIVEYNPQNDDEHKTVRLTIELAESLLL